MAKNKSILISCDLSDNTAIVRIFKYRNYTFAGGKTFELKRGCARLVELAFGCNMKEEDFWKCPDEKAIYYDFVKKGVE